MIKSQIYALEGHVDQNEFEILFLSNEISQKKTEIIFDLLCKTAIIIRVSSNFRQTTVFFQGGHPNIMRYPYHVIFIGFLVNVVQGTQPWSKEIPNQKIPATKKSPIHIFFSCKGGGRMFPCTDESEVSQVVFKTK